MRSTCLRMLSLPGLYGAAHGLNSPLSSLQTNVAPDSEEKLNFGARLVIFPDGFLPCLSVTGASSSGAGLASPPSSAGGAGGAGAINPVVVPVRITGCGTGTSP